jgi:hypothetical protein
MRGIQHFILMTLLLVSSKALAGVEQFRGFNFSLKHRYLIDVSHLEAVEDNVRLATPSLLQQWGVIGAAAEAHYNEYLNLVVVDKDKVQDGAVKNYFDFVREKQGIHFATFASTMFHELAHADYDVFIEESDSNFKFLLNTMIKNWVKKNVKGHSNKIVRHEILGYSADGVIQLLDSEFDKVLFKYGYVFAQDKCMNKPYLEKTAKTLGLERGFEFKNHWGEEDYADRISPDYIWVKGIDVDLGALNFPKIYKRGIFNYFKTTYKLPANRAEMINKLNLSHFLRKVQNCYDEIL